MAIPAIPAQKAACVAGQPTAASYTWNFQNETNQIFKDIQSDAQQALYDADTLQSYRLNPDVDWRTYGDQLNQVKDYINDMGAKLCRLEAIRRVAAPWQQREIDQIATSLRLMADNTEDAIMLGNARPTDLWSAAYRLNLNNLDAETRGLTHSVGKAVEYPGVSKKYQSLRQGLGAPAS
jgi:hypothetical protein